MTRHRLNRSIAAVLALFQLVFTTAVPAVDAWFEAHSAKIAAHHIESQGEGQHAPLHTDNCAVCHQINNWGSSVPTAKAALPAFVLTVAGIPSYYAEIFASGNYHTESLPRAPPANLSI